MMTNREKNEKRLDELGFRDFPNNETAYCFAVRKNGDVVSCAQIPCCECIFRSPTCDEERREWLEDEAEPDKPVPEKKEEKMEKDEIKVGDTVKVTMKSHMKEGEIGIVRMILRTEAGKKLYGVDFDGEICGYALLEYEIEKVKSKKTPPRIVVYRDGDTVTAKDLETGETASAVCSKKDTFDLHTGAFIAMSRLTHFDTDIRLMRLKMEHLDSCISDIRMGFGALMGEGYKYPDIDEEEEA